MLEFNYTFKFPNGDEQSFEVRLNEQTGASLLLVTNELPKWTLLKNHRCEHCPLSPEEHLRCPSAVSIVDVVEYFHGMSSIERVEVRVTSPQRQISKEHVCLPVAIAALIGARFAVSGCPITAKFRPMARHHLPFPSFDEAAYRIVSMYALAQLLRMKDGLEPDWELTELNRICEDVNQMNRDFSRRLRDLQVNDSTVNALSGLDSLLQMVDMTIDEDLMDELKQLFRAHLDD